MYLSIGKHIDCWNSLSDSLLLHSTVRPTWNKNSWELASSEWDSYKPSVTHGAHRDFKFQLVSMAILNSCSCLVSILRNSHWLLCTLQKFELLSTITIVWPRLILKNDFLEIISNMICILQPEHFVSFLLLLTFFVSFAFRLSDENIKGPEDTLSELTFFPTGFRCGAKGCTLNDLWK